MDALLARARVGIPPAARAVVSQTRGARRRAVGGGKSQTFGMRMGPVKVVASMRRLSGSGISSTGLGVGRGLARGFVAVVLIVVSGVAWVADVIGRDLEWF